MNARMRAGYVLFLALLFHILVNLFWLRSDTRPWIWDMAFHARLGLDYVESNPRGNIGSAPLT